MINSFEESQIEKSNKKKRNKTENDSISSESMFEKNIPDSSRSESSINRDFNLNVDDYLLNNATDEISDSKISNSSITYSSIENKSHYQESQIFNDINLEKIKTEESLVSNNEDNLMEQLIIVQKDIQKIVDLIEVQKYFGLVSIRKIQQGSKQKIKDLFANLKNEFDEQNMNKNRKNKGRDLLTEFHTMKQYYFKLFVTSKIDKVSNENQKFYFKLKKSQKIKTLRQKIIYSFTKCIISGQKYNNSLFINQQSSSDNMFVCNFQKQQFQITILRDQNLFNRYHHWKKIIPTLGNDEKIKDIIEKQEHDKIIWNCQISFQNIIDSIIQFQQIDKDYVLIMIQLKQPPRFAIDHEDNLSFDPFSIDDCETINQFLDIDAIQNSMDNEKFKDYNYKIDLVSILLTYFKENNQVLKISMKDFNDLQYSFEQYYEQRIQFQENDNLLNYYKELINFDEKKEDVFKYSNTEQQKNFQLDTIQNIQLINNQNNQIEQNKNIKSDNTIELVEINSKKINEETFQMLIHLISMNLLSIHNIDSKQLYEILNKENSKQFENFNIFLKQQSLKKHQITNLKESQDKFEDDSKFNFEFDQHVEELKHQQKQFQINSINIQPSYINVAFPEIVFENNLFQELKNLNQVINVSLIFPNDFVNKKSVDTIELIKQLMEKTQLNGKNFQIFNYSDSKLRTQGQQAIELNSHQKITEKLGNEVSDYKSQSKLASAFGLNSSSSIFSKITGEIDIIKQEDVERNSYNFTDGVGGITPKCLYDQILQDLKNQKYKQSSFQARINGSKGMITLWPKKLEEINNNNGNDKEYGNDKIKFNELEDYKLEQKIYIRNSMIKSWKKWDKIQVVKMADRMAGTINRQVIILLIGNEKAKESVIFEKAVRNYNLLIQSLKNIDKLIQILNQRMDLKINSSLKCQLFDKKQSELVYKDPFLFGLVVSIILNMLYNLKHKSKFLIEQSARLKGVIDEYKILNEDEVFMCISLVRNEFINILKNQFDNMPKNLNKTNFQFYHQNPKDYKLSEPYAKLLNNKITIGDQEMSSCSWSKINEKVNQRKLPAWFVIEGEVLIAKNPALQVGDLRKVNAVNHKELHHLKNLLVFNQKGTRPLFHQISNSDLDGDEYLIIYDQELIFSNNNAEPLKYDAKQKFMNSDNNKSLPSIKENVSNNMIKHLNSFNIGQVCNLLMSHQDAIDQNLNDKTNEQRLGIIERLTYKANEVIDAPKQGFEVSIEEDLRVKSQPQFIDINKKEMIDSNSLISNLFKLVEIDTVLLSIYIHLSKKINGNTNEDIIKNFVKNKLNNNLYLNSNDLKYELTFPIELFSDDENFNMEQDQLFEKEFIDFIQNYINEEDEDEELNQSIEKDISLREDCLPEDKEQFLHNIKQEWERLIKQAILEFKQDNEQEIFMYSKIETGEKEYSTNEENDQIYIQDEIERIHNSIRIKINDILFDKEWNRKSIAIEAIKIVYKHLMDDSYDKVIQILPNIFDFNFKMNQKINSIIEQNKNNEDRQFKRTNCNSLIKKDRIQDIQKTDKQYSFVQVFFQEEIYNLQTEQQDKLKK